MADISKEIQAFQDAEYGEEVRGSMISLAEKVNDEVVKGTVDAKAAAQNANKAAADADAIRQDLQYKKETDYWRGRPGESGITALASGMFTLALDPTTYDLYAYYPDADNPPAFEYEKATGNLYYITSD